MKVERKEYFIVTDDKVKLRYLIDTPPKVTNQIPLVCVMGWTGHFLPIFFDILSNYFFLKKESQRIGKICPKSCV